MRYAASAFLVASALFLPCLKADPSTQPVAAAATPVQLPPPVPVAALQFNADVFISPFTALNGDNSLDWAGKAVSQNLLTDLARAKFHAVATEKVIGVVADAQNAARAAGARYLITGTYQSIELQVRFNGQVIDVATGNVLGGISATGSPRDLFALEDKLSAEAIEELGKLPTGQQLAQPNAAGANKAAAPVAPALQPPVVVQVIQPPAVAAPGVASSYQGSALQGYVESNRTPSTDFYQQQQDSQDRETNGIYTYDYGNYYNPYLGGYGYGGYGGFGYGGYGNGIGGFGFGIVSGSYGYGSSSSHGGYGGGHGSNGHHEHGGAR